MLLNKLWWGFVLVAVLSYAVGNFNSAITISKLKKQDIRNMGSGNPGTMNMSRNFGLKVGLLVFVLDFFKGVVPTLVTKVVFMNLKMEIADENYWIAAEYLAGFSAVLGHVFPVVYKFKGGKGIATTIGVLAVVEFWFTALFAFIGLVFIFATKIGSMGSFLITAPTIIAGMIKRYFEFYLQAVQSGVSLGYYIFTNVICFLLIALTWLAHRVNIKGMLYGEEHQTDWFGMIKKAILKKKYKKEIR